MPCAQVKSSDPKFPEETTWWKIEGFGLGGSHAAKRTCVDPETPSFCYAFISGKEYVSIHSKDVFFSESGYLTPSILNLSSRSVYSR